MPETNELLAGVVEQYRRNGVAKGFLRPGFNTENIACTVTGMMLEAAWPCCTLPILRPCVTRG